MGRPAALGCIPADHLDEMGQLLCDAPGGFTDAIGGGIASRIGCVD